MATITIDKGDLICWTVWDGGNYTVWDVGTAEYDLPAGKNPWVFINFKLLGGTDWPANEIEQQPINKLNFYDNSGLRTKRLEKKLRDQQGDKVWCIRFKVIKGKGK